MDNFDCTVIGDVFIDVNIEACATIGQLFRGGINYCKSATAVFGGSANVAAGLSLLGGKVAFIGKAGNDLLGKFYARNLEKSGILTRILFDKTRPTGLAVVHIGQRVERSFLVSRGANNALSTAEIRASKDLICKSDYVYLTGCSLVNNPQQEAILEAFELAKKHKKKIVFDPGAYNIVKSKRRLFAELLMDCAVFSPNLEEAEAMVNTKNLDAVIRQLKKKVPLTTLKCGEKGSIFITEEKTLKIPPQKIKCVDTTGAGDAFTAAVVYGLVNKQTIETLAIFSNWFAAQVITKVGARSFLPKSKIEYSLQTLNAREQLIEHARAFAYMASSQCS